jgi:hypothetical protein
VGPLTIEVVEPLQRLRVVVGPNDSGVEADLTFVARTSPLEEPRFTRRAGTRTVMDYTRLTQFGAWEGSLTIDGEHLEIRPTDVLGSRDRSWGVRSVGEREGGTPSTEVPQFFWLWAPVNFDDVCLHFSVQEDADGRQWHWNGEVAPVPSGPAVRAVSVDWEIDWRPGTRRADRAAIELHLLDGREHRVELEPIFEFQMHGLGYFHPRFSHGAWVGEDEMLVERRRLADLDPLALDNLHVQALCRATCGDRIGVGVLEQLVIGPHAPSGFTELLDGAT